MLRFIKSAHAAIARVSINKFVPCMLVAALAPLLTAQVDTGTILGTVRDAAALFCRTRTSR